MDSSQQPFPTSASSSSTSPRSRIELQGPRPAPLRVRKDSHKVRKPPVAPHQQQHFPHLSNSQQQQFKAPIIIYTISPKVIHTNPNDFMTLVQRLTGADQPHHQPAAGGSTSSDDHLFDNFNGGSSSSNNHDLISSAARYAVMDKINSSIYQQLLIGDHRQQLGVGVFSQTHEDQINILGSSASTTLMNLESSSSKQFMPAGILSPGPASMTTPIAPTGFFSPLSSDPNSMSSFFQGLSPVMNQGSNNKNLNFMAAAAGTIGSYHQHVPSPTNYSNLFLSPASIISPNSLDLFNNFGGL